MLAFTRWALLGSLILLGVGCHERPPAAADVLTQMQGYYTCVGMEISGTAVPPDVLQKRGLSYVVRGHELIAFRPTGEEDPVTFRLDSSHSPVHIDFTERHPVKGERTTAGFLKLENGLLTLVMADSTNPADRPKSFRSTGPGQLLLVLKRDEGARW